VTARGSSRGFRAAENGKFAVAEPEKQNYRMEHVSE
jgi:hypothetical protein